VCAGLDVPCRLQAARRRAAVEPLLTFNEGAIMIDDPDYWRERASKARDDVEQASDPEQRRLWRQLGVPTKYS
jgi:hypothetical protein